MRSLLWLPLCAALAAGCLPGATIQYQVTSLPTPGQFQYTYTISDLTLHVSGTMEESIDIDFPVGLFSNLSNGQAGSDFTLLLFQPNNPTGFDGDYSAVAKVDSPSFAGTFSVDVTYLGAGAPGAQSFSISEFDGSGNFVATLSQGTTTQLGVVTATPEPAPVWLYGIAIMALGVFRTTLRRGR